MHIHHLDHLVLTVQDVDATCQFYERILGMQVVTFGESRKALAFGSQKINLHPATQPFEPKAAHPTSGSADFCFITTVPMAQVIEHLTEQSIPIELGPIERTGAVGKINSVYLRDPDHNLIEISNYENLLPDFQRKVEKFVDVNRLVSPLSARMLDLVSEVGEAAKEVLKATHYGQREFSVNDAWVEELGDTLFSLICAANQTGVNLETALNTVLEKYQRRLNQKGDLGSDRQ